MMLHGYLTRLVRRRMPNFVESHAPSNLWNLLEGGATCDPRVRRYLRVMSQRGRAQNAAGKLFLGLVLNPYRPRAQSACPGRHPKTARGPETVRRTTTTCDRRVWK